MRDKVIGIDIGGTNLRGALVDNEGKIHKRMKILSEAELGIDRLIENLAGFVREISEGEQINGIGIGIPGVIDSKNGIITQAPNISKVDNYPLRSVLIEKLGNELDVIIENDANNAALGEWWIGAAKDVNSMLMITLGTGVGGGIVLDGELWRGAQGMAGEIGHITIYPDGAKCKCGNSGCLESYASANAIRRMVNEGLNEKDLGTVLRSTIKGGHVEDIPRVVAEAALGGDAFSIDIWHRVGKALGIGIATLVNLFNIEMIVIGGGVSNAWDLFIDSVLEEASARALRAPMKNAKIEHALLKDDAGIMGAAYLSFNSSEFRKS